MVFGKKTGPDSYVLPCIEVEAAEEHEGDDDDGSDGQGYVHLRGSAGQEISWSGKFRRLRHALLIITKPFLYKNNVF